MDTLELSCDEGTDEEAQCDVDSDCDEMCQSDTQSPTDSGVEPNEEQKCPFCTESLSLKRLVMHLKAEHNQEATYNEEIDKLRRGYRKEDDVKISCPLCEKRVYKSGIAAHLRNMHVQNEPHKCPYCSYSSMYIGNVKTHISGIHHQERKFSCDQCQGTFKTRNGLHGHMRTVHLKMKSKTEAKKYPCPICQKNFTKTNHVNRHLLIHSKEKHFKCEYCGRAFNNKSNMQSHVKALHERSATSWDCDACLQTFKTKLKLQKHVLKVHNMEMPESKLEARQKTLPPQDVVIDSEGTFEKEYLESLKSLISDTIEQCDLETIKAGQCDVDPVQPGQCDMGPVYPDQVSATSVEAPFTILKTDDSETNIIRRQVPHDDGQCSSTAN